MGKEYSCDVLEGLKIDKFEPDKLRNRITNSLRE